MENDFTHILGRAASAQEEADIMMLEHAINCSLKGQTVYQNLLELGHITINGLDPKTVDQIKGEISRNVVLGLVKQGQGIRKDVGVNLTDELSDILADHQEAPVPYANANFEVPKKEPEIAYYSGQLPSELGSSPTFISQIILPIPTTYTHNAPPVSVLLPTVSTSNTGLTIKVNNPKGSIALPYGYLLVENSFRRTQEGIAYEITNRKLKVDQFIINQIQKTQKNTLILPPQCSYFHKRHVGIIRFLTNNINPNSPISEITSRLKDLLRTRFYSNKNLNTRGSFSHDDLMHKLEDVLGNCLTFSYGISYMLNQIGYQSVVIATNFTYHAGNFCTTPHAFVAIYHQGLLHTFDPTLYLNHDHYHHPVRTQVSQNTNGSSPETILSDVDSREKYLQNLEFPTVNERIFEEAISRTSWRPTKAVDDLARDCEYGNYYIYDIVDEIDRDEEPSERNSLLINIDSLKKILRELFRPNQPNEDYKYREAEPEELINSNLIVWSKSNPPHKIVVREPVVSQPKSNSKKELILTGFGINRYKANLDNVERLPKNTIDALKIIVAECQKNKIDLLIPFKAIDLQYWHYHQYPEDWSEGERPKADDHIRLYRLSHNQDSNDLNHIIAIILFILLCYDGVQLKGSKYKGIPKIYINKLESPHKIRILDFQDPDLKAII